MHHGHVNNLKPTLIIKPFFSINFEVGQGTLNFFEIFLWLGVVTFLLFHRLGLGRLNLVVPR
jgi:hypothetical protein